ncbi:TetR/AcrR family transcriptional regulator [Salinibacterium sp. NYA9b]
MRDRQRNARGSGDQLRDQLVAAASEMLLTPQSIAPPSLRAVARACSVSPAAVYLHFESQHALIDAVIQAQMQALGHAIGAAVEGTSSPIARAYAFGVAYATWGIEHPGAYQLLFESADRHGNSAHEADWGLLESAAILLVDVTGTDLTTANVIAFRLWASLHGIVSLRLHKVEAPWPTSLEGEVRAVIDSLVGNVGATS